MLRKLIVRLTPEEYLAAERKAENKSELIDGEVVAMSGASRRHNLIAVNLTREISLQLKDRPCEAYASGMRVRAASANQYTYPDVAAVCGEPRFEDEHADTLLNPTLIVEVLSESTETFDRGKKFDSYRTIESLAEYLLVSQGAYRIEQHTKQTDGRWQLSEYRSLHDAVVLPSIQCKLALREVYDKIKLS
jgi:Uma2 family endonuclease